MLFINSFLSYLYEIKVSIIWYEYATIGNGGNIQWQGCACLDNVEGGDRNQHVSLSVEIGRHCRNTGCWTLRTLDVK